MNKRLAFVASVLSLALLPPVQANGVEFGQDATGDPNAVHIMGNTSGFLYSERIIFTAAHVLNQVRVQPNGETNGFVYAPGVADKTGAKKFKIAKMFFPATYVNASSTTQPEDDFAIVVLQEDMPVTMRVQIATEAQMVQFAATRAKVEMVGYGLQSGNQRSNPQEDKRAPHKLSSYLYTPQMMNNFYATDGGRPAYWSKIEWGSIHTELLGSICSGDSGAGFYVDQNNTRFYVGTAGNGLGLSNCSPNESVKMNPNGGMSWFPAPFKFLDLLKSAESFVTEEKRKEVVRLEEARIAQELKVKQAANEKAKAEAELKAKLEAEEKAKAEAELKAKLDAEAKIAADLKARLDAEAKIAAEAAAQVAAGAALLAAVKKGQDLAKKLNLGKPCPKLKSAKTVSDVKFVCVKKGKKLVWALR